VPAARAGVAATWVEERDPWTRAVSAEVRAKEPWNEGHLRWVEVARMRVREVDPRTEESARQKNALAAFVVLCVFGLTESVGNPAKSWMEW
jgi:hypothetical protein